MTVDYRQTLQPPHDPADPTGHLNALEAALLAVRLPRCPHCDDRREVLPMSGNGWGVETTHEPGCPEHEDNQPAAEYHEPTRPQHRCGTPRLDGQPCGTFVARPGQHCRWHQQDGP